MFYNVENLFDTIDDPITNDNEFLPNAKNIGLQENTNENLKILPQLYTEFIQIQIKYHLL